MTTISLIIAFLFICSKGFCIASKALRESVKIAELDGLTSLIQFKASRSAINSAVYTEHKSGILFDICTLKYTQIYCVVIGCLDPSVKIFKYPE